MKSKDEILNFVRENYEEFFHEWSYWKGIDDILDYAKYNYACDTKFRHNGETYLVIQRIGRWQKPDKELHHMYTAEFAIVEDLTTNEQYIAIVEDLSDNYIILFKRKNNYKNEK